MAAEKSLLLINADYYDTEKKCFSHGHILAVDGRIKEIYTDSAAAQAAAPAGAVVFDAAGLKVLPGVVGLTYVRNYGAAFSSFQGMQWLFAVIFILFTVAIIWEYRKKSMKFTTFEWWCIAAIYGGGVGNMIDRVRCGYVVDMIQTQFMDFPIFNVADCFISCGCVILIAHLIFFNKAFWKEEKK